MIEMFETLKGLFADPAFVPDTLELRETVCVLANQAFAQIAAAGADDKAGPEAALQGFAAAARAGGNLFLVSILEGLLQAATGRVAHLRKAIEAALDEDAADVGVAMNAISVIDRLSFTGAIGPADLDGVYDYEARRRHWLRLVDRAEAVVRSAGLDRKARFSQNDRVLILTDQFLQPPHAPTKDALEFGKLFQDAGAEAVMIASTCALGEQLYSPIMPGSRCAVNDALRTLPAFAFDGRAFRYHQPANGRFNNATLVETLAAVEGFDPAFVLAIGGQSLVGELLSARSFVVQYPTFAGLPTTKALRFFMWREPTAQETALLDRLGLADRHLFSHHPGFETPERLTSLSRAEFGVPAGAFVFAVVGMRLDLDVDQAFIALLREIRRRREDAHFLFVGVFDAFSARVGQDPSLAGAVTHIGYQSDIMAAYALCDAYLNPTRKGGGSAIVHAMAAGLPALSVGQGDAYEAVRDFPAIGDYAAMADVACALADRGETYRAYVEAVRRKAPDLQGKAPVMARLIAAYDRFLADS